MTYRAIGSYPDNGTRYRFHLVKWNWNPIRKWLVLLWCWCHYGTSGHVSPDEPLLYHSGVIAEYDDHLSLPLTCIVPSTTIKASQYGWSLEVHTTLSLPCSWFKFVVASATESYHQVLECNHKQWQWPVKFGGLWDLSGQQLQKVIFFLSLGLSVASRRGIVVLIQGKFILVHFHICTLYMCTYIIRWNMYLGSFYSCKFSIAFFCKGL